MTQYKVYKTELRNKWQQKVINNDKAVLNLKSIFYNEI